MTSTQIPQRITLYNEFLRECELHVEWGTLDDETSARIVRRMERSCFSHTIKSCEYDGINRSFNDKKFIERYSAVCYRILSNLRHAYLIEGLISGTISPSRVALMTSEELCPDARQHERDINNQRRIQPAPEKVLRTYKCSKCGDNRTTSIKYQSRAADEDNTISIKCETCGHVWRGK